MCLSGVGWSFLVTLGSVFGSNFGSVFGSVLYRCINILRIIEYDPFFCFVLAPEFVPVDVWT